MARTQEQRTPFVIGLTGGIASGKSAVSDTFAQLGITIVDADVVAREVVEPGQPGLAGIEDLYGAEVLNSDGTLDRKKMRSAMFADNALRAKTEALLHPLIRERMWQQVAESTTPYCLLVVPLLIESGGYNLVDRVLVVQVAEQTQRARLMARDGSSAAEVDAILEAQTTADVRLSRADDVIDNNADLDALRQEVKRLHQIYLRLSQARPDS